MWEWLATQKMVIAGKNDIYQDDSLDNDQC